MRHVLHLASNQADRYPQGRARTDNVIFDISSADLTADNDQQIMMYVESACIPVAGFPINATNNIVYFFSDGGPKNVVIPVGVYANGTALVAALNAALTTAVLTGVSFAWVPLTYSITCTRTVATVWSILAAQSTARSVIGLGWSNLTLPQSVVVPLPGVIDLAGPKKFLITSPGVTLQSRDSIGNSVNVLAAIPVNQSFGGLVAWQNSTGGMLTTNRKCLSDLQLTLLDEDQLPVDLNGLEWAVSIVIEIY